MSWAPVHSDDWVQRSASSWVISLNRRARSDQLSAYRKNRWTINDARYIERHSPGPIPAFRIKRGSLLSNGVVLLHDKETSNTNSRTIHTLKEFAFEPCRPHVGQSDYPMFASRRIPREPRFRSVEDVKTAMYSGHAAQRKKYRIWAQQRGNQVRKSRNVKVKLGNPVIYLCSPQGSYNNFYNLGIDNFWLTLVHSGISKTDVVGCVFNVRSDSTGENKIRSKKKKKNRRIYSAFPKLKSSI